MGILLWVGRKKLAVFGKLMAFSESVDERSQFGACRLDTIARPVRRLSDAVDAFLAAGKRPRREIAVILHRVPAVFDAAHIGFVFTDVMRNGHVMLQRSSDRPNRPDRANY